jgi:hypothetical protein
MARQDNNLDAVQFTRESAERIAGVVRAAELSPAVASPLDFGRRVVDQRIPKQVRAATFTGSWSVGASKVVTFKYAPTATANVTNLSWPITHNHSVAENCVVGKEGTSWWLVVPVLQTATAVFVMQTTSTTVMSSIQISASLNTSNCTITVSQAPATSKITVISQTATSSYLRLRVP